MNLRPIATADMGDVAALHAACFPRSWSAGDLWDMAARPGAVGLLAESSGERRLDGFILCWRTLEEAEVLTLVVARQARRAGLGRSLLEEAAGLCAAEGATSLFLEVAADNAPALALYRTAGFEERGRRKGYYRRDPPGPAIDALVLQRRLTPPSQALILG